jgi:sodium-dependent phosphate transporter
VLQIAAIFEFGGAMLLGRVVTNTIAGGIADPTVFARQPEIYAYGMVVALAIGFLWQGWASYAGMNVSATHSISEHCLLLGLCYAAMMFCLCKYDNVYLAARKLAK